MQVIKKADELSQWVEAKQQKGCSVGFVPTMGALHQGHLSLIKAAKEGSDYTVCSIFVNPTQFNDKDDLKKYPRKTGQDLLLLEQKGTDVVFLPEVEEIYPPGGQDWKPIDFGGLEGVLEGAFRPGHFQGVAQVVTRLLDIVHPDHLYMGQKDFQQVAIIKEMLTQYPNPPELVVVPTVRELHGLAMSSRNERLSATDRMRAGKLFEALTYIKQGYKEGRSLRDTLLLSRKLLDFPGFKIEYLEVCDRRNLQKLERWGQEGSMVALVATWLKDVRLIDNVLI